MPTDDNDLPDADASRDGPLSEHLKRSRRLPSVALRDGIAELRRLVDNIAPLGTSADLPEDAAELIIAWIQSDVTACVDELSRYDRAYLVVHRGRPKPNVSENARSTSKTWVYQDFARAALSLAQVATWLHQSSKTGTVSERALQVLSLTGVMRCYEQLVEHLRPAPADSCRPED